VTTPEWVLINLRRHGSIWTLSPLRRVKAFLKAHPVVCLLLLSPGIPEYLSSSSPISALVLNPPMFAFQLVANLGLYGPGVLLVREAKIRWNKGLATVLLLGAAYGILEEGVALSTLFNPEASPVGTLGTYGHWLGVSWIWVIGILPVHMIFSITLPILLLGLALPETRGRSFLAGRKLELVLLLLGADVASLFLVVWRVEQFWMGWQVFLASWTAIGILVLAARRVPSGAPAVKSETPRVGPVRAIVLGIAFYPAVLLSEFLPAAASVPAAVDFVVVLAVQAAFFACVMRVLGKRQNERVILSLSFGLIVPIAAIGVVAERALPLTLVADAVMVMFFMKVWRRYPVESAQEASGSEPTNRVPAAADVGTKRGRRGPFRSAPSL
jgi:hypothetical protein